MKTPEGLVKDEIKRGLAEYDIWYFMPVQGGYGRRAIDFICCWRGRFIAIEAKAGVNKVSKHQETTLADIENAGGSTVVAYSWEDVKSMLDKIEQKI